MRVVIQRVIKANVSVDQKIVGDIGNGLVILVGFTHKDDEMDIKYIVNKIVNLRIFDDKNGIMNLSVKDIKGSILSISQFTLYADTQKGRRPSYINSLEGNLAEPLYNQFNEYLAKEDLKIATGIFGADMKISLINDGPVTIIIDSKE